MLYFDMRCYERLILFALGVCVVFVDAGKVGSSDMSVRDSDVERPAVMSITEEVWKAIMELKISSIEEQVNLVLNKVISCKDLINRDDLSDEQILELQKKFSEIRGKTIQRYLGYIIKDIDKIRECGDPTEIDNRIVEAIDKIRECGDSTEIDNRIVEAIDKIRECGDPTKIDNSIVEEIVVMINHNIISNDPSHGFKGLMLNIEESFASRKEYIAKIECTKCLFEDFKKIVVTCKKEGEDSRVPSVPICEKDLLENIRKLGHMSFVSSGVYKNVSDKVGRAMEMIFGADATKGRISDKMADEIIKSLMNSIKNKEGKWRSPNVVLFYDVMNIFECIFKSMLNHIKSNSQLTRHFEEAESTMTLYVKVLNEKLLVLQSNDEKVIEKAKTRANMIKLNLIGELLQQRGVSVSVTPLMTIVADSGAHP